MRTVNAEQAQPDAARRVEANAWLDQLADLLEMFRATAGRPPSDAELAQLFAHATDTEEAP